MDGIVRKIEVTVERKGFEKDGRVIEYYSLYSDDLGTRINFRPIDEDKKLLKYPLDS